MRAGDCVACIGGADLLQCDADDCNTDVSPLYAITEFAESSNECCWSFATTLTWQYIHFECLPQVAHW